MKQFCKAAVVSVAMLGLVAAPMTSAFAEGKKGGGGKVYVKPNGGGHRHNNTGRNIAIGVGVAAALLAAGAAANASEGGGGRQCRRWDRLCDDGERWACRKLDKYCN